MPPSVLPPDWYARDAATVARNLLGAVLVRTLPDGTVRRARVVETEAYVGAHDLACHARSGRTARTDVMYGPAGHAYVYLIYGMHDMLNIVTGPEGDPQAVLVRAAEPFGPEGAPPPGRTNGPGRLTRTLGITRELNRHPLWTPPLWLEAGRAPEAVTATARIGIDYAPAPWRDAPLRYYDSDSPHVSRR